jgi:CubicO group peptidase (beta-lactamase class C family)
LENAIDKSQLLIEKYMIEEGIPGLVAGVSVKGKQVWVKGFGFSDIENGVKCHENTVMRIASITKTLGTTLVSKLVEENKLKWDSDIHEYIGEKFFPKKQWKGLS